MPELRASALSHDPSLPRISGMVLYRTTSIVQLIRRGLFLIALLLVFGQIGAIISVNHLTSKSGQAVHDAAETLHTSQLLATELAFMERSARQYQVIGETDLHQAYLEHRQQFLHHAQMLSSKPLTDVQRNRLEALLAAEDDVFLKLSHGLESEEAQLGIEGFWILNAMARAILGESQEFISQEVKKIQDAAAATNRQLLFQAVALIVAALVLAGLYSRVINRPLRELERAINRLGEGNFTESISVGGPLDLKELGQQLEGLRKQLLALEQHKATMLRSVSHELKTPLAAIREGVALLNDQVPGTLNRQQSEVIEILQTHSAKLQKLIENLINLNIAQGEEPSMKRRPVELDQVLMQVIDEQKLMAEARGLTIKKTLGTARVIGDSEKLKSIFMNLLSNAIRHAPNGSEIRIELRPDTEFATVDVIDQGPGIKPSERSKVFDLFYQAPTTMDGKDKGTGVGLAIARAYVQLHKGTIEIVDNPDGAHFRVALPSSGR